MTQPTLGIVVPHRDQWGTLSESFESLFRSKVNKRVVMVDDFSDINEPFYGYGPLAVQQENKTMSIELTPHQGVQFARNIGYYALRRHGCEYTLFSDSDVIWCPGALDKLVDAIERSGEAYAYCDYGRTGCSMGTWVSGEWNEKKLRSCNYISTMSVIRTEALEECGVPPFDESIERLQDWDLWLTFLKKGYRGTYVQETLFTTKFRMGSISMRPGYQEAINVVKKKHELP